jgi:hypothetical protein
VSTAARPAISVCPALGAKERETLIQRVEKTVEERVWDPQFQRTRWRDAVEAARPALLGGLDMREFEELMDALVRRANEFMSIQSKDLAFFHKSQRKTRSSRLASHFRYCQPSECSPSQTRPSQEGDVLYSKLDEHIGWLKVTKFPGAVGIDIANQITRAFAELAECKHLVVDLRGSESGGLAFVRLASYLVPDRKTIGYSVTRRGSERQSMDGLKTFGWIPNRKVGLLWLVAKYGFSDPSVRVETEGLGAKVFHGRTVVVVDEATTGAGERIAAFAAEEKLAPVIGTRTAGQVICSDSKAVGNDFFVRIPARAWYTPRKRLLEGVGVSPDVQIKTCDGASDDPQLSKAKEIVRSL